MNAIGQQIVEQEARAGRGLEYSRQAGPARSNNSLWVRPLVWLSLFTLLYFSGEACAAARKIMWTDELFTYDLAALPSLAELWKAILLGTDGNPPLSFVLTRLSHAVFGANHVSTRLPAMAGFWVMAICLFLFVRRRTDTLHGFIALLLPFFTFASEYTIEARPYAIVLGGSAAALLCWQSAAQKLSRPWSLAGLALSLAVLVSCHYYAIYVAGAIPAGEMVRSVTRRKLDAGIWLSVIGGTSVIAFYWPLIATSRGSMAHFWAAPRAVNLLLTYLELCSPLWIAMLAIAAVTLALRSAKPPKKVRPALPLHEAVTGALLIAMPLVMFFVAKFVTNAFWPRYVLPAAVGLAICLPAFLYRIGPTATHISRSALCVLAAGFCLMQFRNISSLYRLADPATQVRQAYSFPTEPKLPIVIAGYHDYWPFRHYGPKEIVARCYFLTDADAAVRILGNDTGERLFQAWNALQESHVVPYKSFVAEHADFYALRSANQGWVLEQLARDGAELRPITIDKHLVPFSEEQMYFRVHVPAPTR